MGEGRIAHDAAWAGAAALTEAIRGLFRPEEIKDAHTLIFEHFLAAIEAAFIQKSRQDARIRPHLN